MDQNSSEINREIIDTTREAGSIRDNFLAPKLSTVFINPEIAAKVVEAIYTDNYEQITKHVESNLEAFKQVAENNNLDNVSSPEGLHAELSSIFGNIEYDIYENNGDLNSAEIKSDMVARIMGEHPEVFGGKEGVKNDLNSGMALKKLVNEYGEVNPDGNSAIYADLEKFAESHIRIKELELSKIDEMMSRSDELEQGIEIQGSDDIYYNFDDR